MRRLLSVIFSVLFVCALFVFTIHIDDYAPEQISKITVWDGLTTGKEFEITDAETISDIVEKLNKLSPSFGIRLQPAGCHYSVRLYDASGNIVAAISLTDHDIIYADRCSYWCPTTELIEYLSQLDA